MKRGKDGCEIVTQQGQMGTNKLRIVIINCYWKKLISMRLCFTAEGELLV